MFETERGVFFVSRFFVSPLRFPDNSVATDPRTVPSPTPGTATIGVHGGEPRPNPLRSVSPPLVASTSFHFGTLQEAIDVVEGRLSNEDYGRYANPTVRTAERKIAALEGAQDCALFGSGMAALSGTMLTLLSSGQHLLLGREGYRPSEQFLTGTLGRLGITHDFFDHGDLDAIDRLVRPGQTRVVFVESPSNPFQRVVDLPALADRVHRHRGVQLVVDATFATPLGIQAHTLGADLVLQSATKYLGGHNDLLAGAVSGKAPRVQAIRELRGQLGGILDPHAAWLLCRGIKSLGPRVRQHAENALAVARFLQSYPRVRRVWHPFLQDHVDHAVALAQLRFAGSVVTFEHDGDLAATHRFCDAVEVFQIGASLGGAESLLHPPAVFSYWDLPAAQRLERGISDGLIRLAVGLEDPADLVADLAQALDRI